MIEDDFDKMIRRMFEQLFQNAGIFEQIRNNQIRIQSPQNRPINPQGNTAPRIEQIELGDRMLVLIDNIQESTAPVAKIAGRELNVTINEKQDDILIELPYAVDIDESSILHHNGIIEISLIKATDVENSSDIAERILKNDLGVENL